MRKRKGKYEGSEAAVQVFVGSPNNREVPFSFEGDLALTDMNRCLSQTRDLTFYSFEEVPGLLSTFEKLINGHTLSFGLRIQKVPHHWDDHCQAIHQSDMCCVG